MLIEMCRENSCATMEKLGAQLVGVQDRALKLCPGEHPEERNYTEDILHATGLDILVQENAYKKEMRETASVGGFITICRRD